MTVAHLDHSKNLNKYAFFKVHDHAVSDDLVQDTFTKTWKYLVKGGRIHAMKAFLYHVLNNLIVDEYRKNKPVSLEVLSERGFEPADDNSSRFLDFLDGKAAILLIKFLPARYQAVMRMRYTRGLSLREISLITGQTKNALAVQSHRGLEKLKILYNRG